MRWFLLFAVGMVGFILAPVFPLVGAILCSLFGVVFFIRIIYRAGEDW